MNAFIIICTAIGCASAGFVAGAVWCGMFRKERKVRDDRWSDYPCLLRKLRKRNRLLSLQRLAHGKILSKGARSQCSQRSRRSSSRSRRSTVAAMSLL